MKGKRTSSSRASAAETLASCMRLMVPSIMRAPPEQETTTSGWRVSMANSIARVTFSPTTAPIEPAFHADDGVIHAQLLAGFPKAHGVGLGVDKLERVRGRHTRVVFRPARVEQHFQALLGVHLEMELALGADKEISFQVLAKNDRAARLALDPQPLRAYAALFRRRSRIDRFFVSLKPGHRKKLTSSVRDR